jgi:uncharacterized protein YecT (DUF1311 family)
MKRLSHLFTIIAAGLALAGFVSAAEEKTPTLKEAKAEFEKQDRALNAVWDQAKKDLGAADFAMLKEKQRDWVEWRDHLAGSPMFSGAPDGDETQRKQTPEYFSVAAGLTEDRTAWLRGALSKAPDDSMNGKWMDSYGGVIELVEKDGKLHFSINAVRGPSAHVGQLSGIAQWNERIGWFSDKGLDKEKTEETNLAFVLDGTKLQITGANTKYYHGARAYFDGEYVKTEKLDAKTEAEVLKAAKTGGAAER